jgi:hypothetical protein
VKLPNGHRAVLGDKLKEYTLNPDHRRGEHKARLFASILGITVENQQILEAALLAAAQNADNVESRGDNGYGRLFTITISLTTPKATATVKSIWIIRHEEDFPPLASCYIV